MFIGNRMLRLAAVALTGLAMPTASTATSAVSRFAKPKPLANDLKYHMKWPWGDKHTATKAVRELATDRTSFESPTPFLLLSKDKKVRCDLAISVATNSVNIPKYEETDAANGYILGLITAPSRCAIKGAELGDKDTVAWFARFTKGPQTGTPDQRIDDVGDSGFVFLHGGYQKNEDDKWFPRGRDWSLGFCNHSNQQGAMNDKATGMTYKQACDVPGSPVIQHDLSLLSRLLIEASQSPAFRTMYRGQRLDDPTDGDVAVWFACGGDCCYANII